MNFPQFGRILYMQTNLSAALCAIRSGGERSGLTAHFFFGVKLARFGVGLKRIHDNRALKRGFKGIDYFHPEDQDLSLGLRRKSIL